MGRKPKAKKDKAKVSGGVGCFGDVGTGKSLVAVSLIQNMRFALTLILTKRAVVTTHVWEQEFSRHLASDIDIVVLHPDMTLNERLEMLNNALANQTNKPMVVLATWSICADSHAEALRDRVMATKWNLVVADEGHAMKTPTSKTSRFCYQLAQKSQYQLELTATPTPNNPLEAFGQYKFLDTSIFGTTYGSFKDKVAVLGGYQNKEVKEYKNQDWQKEQMFRIGHLVNKDVLDLPPLISLVKKFFLDSRTADIYHTLEQDLYAQYEAGETTASNALVQMVRLQQLTSGFLRTDDQMVGDARDGNVRVVYGHNIQIHSGKQQLLRDTLEDIRPDMPVVIFARFHEDLDSIKQVCESLGRSCAELSGRKDQTNDWKEGKFCDIVVQIQAGGAGINLTRASYAIFYSLSYSRLDFLQAQGRVHRPGQTRNTTYIYLVAEGTIDESVLESMAAKETVTSYLLDRLGRQ